MAKLSLMPINTRTDVAEQFRHILHFVNDCRSLQFVWLEMGRNGVILFRSAPYLCRESGGEDGSWDINDNTSLGPLFYISHKSRARDG